MATYIKCGFRRLLMLAPGSIFLQNTTHECSPKNDDISPCAVATWTFGSIAIDKSSELLAAGSSAVEAVEEGIRRVEADTRDQYYVGEGGFPNSEGIMELDAALMDGDRRYGAVLALRDIQHPISVARTIMEKCVHNVLVADGAQKWAIANGFKLYPHLLTPEIEKQWRGWKTAKLGSVSFGGGNLDSKANDGSHDTIGLICLDKDGKIACGTSTSGWAYKHPGRIGDAPLIGSGLYCDQSVGAAVATGDGEEIMRTCLTFLVVEFMRVGHSPQEACRMGIERLATLKRDGEENLMHDQLGSNNLYVGIIAMSSQGEVGAASTLSEANPDNYDNKRPSFPVACWRGGPSPVSLKFLEASTGGAKF